MKQKIILLTLLMIAVLHVSGQNKQKKLDDFFFCFSRE
jgi:hypothetical protein